LKNVTKSAFKPRLTCD